MKTRRPCDYNALKNNPEIMRDFVSDIISQAIADYVRKPHRRDEVSQFFKSEWGAYLCASIDLDATEILNKLEKGKIYLKGA